MATRWPFPRPEGREHGRRKDRPAYARPAAWAPSNTTPKALSASYIGPPSYYRRSPRATGQVSSGQVSSIQEKAKHNAVSAHGRRHGNTHPALLLVLLRETIVAPVPDGDYAPTGTGENFPDRAQGRGDSLDPSTGMVGSFPSISNKGTWVLLTRPDRVTKAVRGSFGARQV